MGTLSPPITWGAMPVKEMAPPFLSPSAGGGDASFPLSSGPTQTPAEKRREEEGAGLESRW